MGILDRFRRDKKQTEGQLDSVKRKTGGRGLRPCAVCGEEIKGGFTGDHFRTKHPEYKFIMPGNATTINCGECGSSVGSFKALVTHWERMHFKNQPPEGETSWGGWTSKLALFITCPMCGEEINQKALADHFSKSHPEIAVVRRAKDRGRGGGRLQCGKCGAKLSSYRALVEHYIHSHPEVPVDQNIIIPRFKYTLYDCPKCGALIHRSRFPDHFSQKHPEYGFLFKRDHSGRRRLHCLECKNQLTTWARLIKHWDTIHHELINRSLVTTQEEPGEGLPKEAPQTPEVKRKIQLRGICVICGIRIPQGSMADHFQTVHPEYRFGLVLYNSPSGAGRKPKCGECKARVGSFSKLVKHWDVHHSELLLRQSQVKERDIKELDGPSRTDEGDIVAAAIKLGARVIEGKEAIKMPKESPARFRHEKIKKTIMEQLGDKPPTIENVEIACEKTRVIEMINYGPNGIKKWIQDACDDLGLSRRKKETLEPEQEKSSSNGARLDDVDRKVSIMEQAVKLQGANIKSVEASLKDIEAALSMLIKELGGDTHGGPSVPK